MRRPCLWCFLLLMPNVFFRAATSLITFATSSCSGKTASSSSLLLLLRRQNPSFAAERRAHTTIPRRGTRKYTGRMASFGGAAAASSSLSTFLQDDGEDQPQDEQSSKKKKSQHQQMDCVPPPPPTQTCQDSTRTVSERLDRVLAILPSLTDSVALDSENILNSFLLGRSYSTQLFSPNWKDENTAASDGSSCRLSQRVVEAAAVFRAIASRNGTLQTRQELQRASQEILSGTGSTPSEQPPDLQHHGIPATAAAPELALSHPFSLSLVIAVLALSSTYDNNGTASRSAASAMSASLELLKRQQQIATTAAAAAAGTTPLPLLEELVHAVVCEAATSSSASSASSLPAEGHDGQQQQQSNPAAVAVVDLHILTALARAVGVASCRTNEMAAEALGEVMIRAKLLGGGSVLDDDDDDDRQSEQSGSTSSQSRRSAAPERIVSDAERADMAAALACATQLGHPWRVLSPAALVEAAVSYKLWHAAERVCQTVVQQQQQQQLFNSSSSTATGNDAAAMVEAAVHGLVDAALEARLYRLADAYATAFYDAAGNGGPSRYLDARYLHACDTIAKVIRKRALPIIERQAERVDKAVAKVVRSTGTTGAASAAAAVAAAAVDASGEDTRDCFTCVDTASSDIRNFAIHQLEESGDIDTVHRFTELWGMEYIHDEERLKAVLAAKRDKYLQWDELFPDVPVPSLTSTPDALLQGFRELVEQPSPSPHGKVYGFDVEWTDDSSGAALLQISTLQTVLLVDIVSLSKTAEGADALASTVGSLFASSDAVVVGFACRQDLSMLRSTPCPTRGGVQQHHHQQWHWLKETFAVVDLKDLVAAATCPGLSRCCLSYLGKLLDKSEQCSLWTRRPLSAEQRAYAAMDAHVCALIYLKMLEDDATATAAAGTTTSSSQDLQQQQHPKAAKKARASDD